MIRHTFIRLHAAVILALVFSSIPTFAQSSLESENERFPNKPFFRALRKRGLTDLLDLHLKDYPPANKIEAALLRRDVMIAIFEDRSRTHDQRNAAITAANQILEQLIIDEPNNSRSRKWRIELARSLLYMEADPYVTQILFKGPRPGDRSRLRTTMTHTVEHLEQLHNELQSEYDRLDDLPARVYDKKEATGDIEALESNLSLTDYMLAWSRFYLSISLEKDEPDRTAPLREALEYLDRSNLLRTPHAESHYQAQTTLLAGMTHRQLADFGSARRALARSIDIVDDILDPTEQQSLRWIATLAQIELVRSFVDVNNFETAQQALRIFQKNIRKIKPVNHDQLILAGLLERFVYRAKATNIAKGQPDSKNPVIFDLLEKSTESLFQIAQHNPSQKNNVYAAIYEYIDPETPASSMSTFEQAVVVTGALNDADIITNHMNATNDDAAILKANKKRRKLLTRAIDLAQGVLNDSNANPILRREVAFNLAVAKYRLGQRDQAAEAFLFVTKNFPDHPRALEAATFAVQLAFELQSDPTLATSDRIQSLYIDTLRTLTDSFPDALESQYWLFFLAQQLANQNDFDTAADIYTKVPPNHERYHEARFLAAEAHVLSLQSFAIENPDRVDLINRRATVADFAARQARQSITQAHDNSTDPTRQQQLKNLLARTDLILAESNIVPGVNRYDDALNSLKNFRETYGHQPDLLGRVLRVRTIALEALGRHAEATRLIPEYVAKDPTGAPPTLQALFDSINKEIARDRKAHRTQEATEKAETAVAIAKGIHTAAQDQPSLFNKQTVYALKLQLAESYLTANHPNEAATLFEQCLSEDAANSPDNQPRDSRAIFGTAETRFQSDKFKDALPLFNQIYKSSPKPDILKWKSLLRDLQCRTNLNHPKEDIIRAIQQQRYLNPQLGSPNLRRQFDELLTQNQKR